MWIDDGASPKATTLKRGLLLNDVSMWVENEPLRPFSPGIVGYLFYFYFDAFVAAETALRRHLKSVSKRLLWRAPRSDLIFS